jgi:hypothetical protein
MSPDSSSTPVVIVSDPNPPVPDSVVAAETEALVAPDSVRLFSEQLAQLQSARERGRFSNTKHRGANPGAFGKSRHR